MAAVARKDRKAGTGRMAGRRSPAPTAAETGRKRTVRTGTPGTRRRTIASLVGTAGTA